VVVNRTMRAALCAVLLIATSLGKPALFGQSSNTAHPESFEVASIRMVQPYSNTQLLRAGNNPFGSYPSDRFVALHVPLSFLISVAFKFDTARVITSENWQEDQLYDIAATVPGNQQLTLDEMLPLVRDLLKQRFHLTTHIQEPRISGFAMITGKMGPKVRRSATDAEPSAYIHSNQLWARHVSIETLAGMLARPVGATVDDQTGLEGSYDFDLRFRAQDDSNSALPDIFTAVEEQLGLKLIPAKVPVKYLIVDHVDRVPTEN